MKKILVTGGLGFIGSHFIHTALQRGFTVTNIDKQTYASRKNLIFGDKNYSFIKKDIIDLREIPEGIDTIFHFAAETHVDSSLTNPRLFIETNIIGTHTLLERIKDLPKEERPSLIYISTDEVYGEIENGSFPENSQQKAGNIYAATKASAEQLVISYGKTYGINYKIIRMSNVYGSYQHPEKLIPKVIQCIKNREQIPIHGDGSYKREWTFIDDVVTGLLLIGEDGEDTNIYNLSSSEEYSNLSVIKMLLEAFEAPEGLLFFTDNRKGQDSRYSISTEKIRSLGWSPKMSLKKYIQTLNKGI